MTVESTGSEEVELDAEVPAHLQPKRFRYRYQCQLCGHEYSKVCKAVPRVDPPCPNPGCADKARIAELEANMERLQKMLESGVPPAQIGHKTVVKAIDETAKIVMDDYQLTNLRDGIGHGETMAPKLDPLKQQQADQYFGGGGFSPKQIASVTGAPATHGITSAQANLLGRRAMAGAFRNMAVPPTVVRPKAQQGESPLVRVGIEKLK